MDTSLPMSIASSSNQIFELFHYIKNPSDPKKKISFNIDLASKQHAPLQYHNWTSK